MTTRSLCTESAYQVLEAVEADFEAMTWTFRLGQDNYVSGGHYAVMPSQAFAEMKVKLVRAECLLRRVLKGENGPTFMEHVQSHFDPKPL